MKNKKIVVTGDICVNSLISKENIQNDNNFSYEKFPKVNVVRTLGGALLVTKLVKLATNSSEIYSPVIDNIEDSLKENILTSIAEVDKFYLSNSQREKGKVFRIKNFFGYSIDQSQDKRIFNVVDDPQDAGLVILDDENNGFNNQVEAWPRSITTEGISPFIIYKTSTFSGGTKLGDHLFRKHNKKTIVVINCEDLRGQGVNISKGLSWEKTATDFIWQMKNNKKLMHLSECKHLIITLGVEGAIYYSSDMDKPSKLYFLTSRFEGEFLNDSKGKMYGVTSCFVAGLSKSLINLSCNEEDEFLLVHNGIKKGLVYSHKYYRDGFGREFDIDNFPSPSLFTQKIDDFIIEEHIQDVYIKDTTVPGCKGCWNIIKDKSNANLEEIAEAIVLNGSEKALEFTPTAKFRNLKTVDREEIEDYRGIKNLISEYLSNPNTVRPLSIGVFGTPGSGKSFGVTEVASSIAPNLIKKLDFNLSQFQSVSDLVSAFHKVRDIALEQKVPLVFFDEFDSAFGGKLGWLKYFLAPMQDGLFREGDSLHPIGKAIFVFAGGTSNTYEEFCNESGDLENTESLDIFKGAKGPDFVSRLRGFINILGPNPKEGQTTQLFIIRRAMLLRSLIERKTPHLLNSSKEAKIDTGIIKAMLKIPNYKHGSRSMEAIIDMSMVSDTSSWEQSHLPPKSHLKLHVDEEEFFKLLMKEEFFIEKLESVTKDLYNRYRMLYTNCDTKFINSWSEVSLDTQRSLRKQVNQITQGLRKINVEIYPTTEKPEAFTFTESEIQILLEITHQNILIQKKKNGWKYGEILDGDAKTDPLLMEFSNLSEKSKKVLINYIKEIPKIFANSNLKFEKFRNPCFCDQNIEKNI